MILFRLHRSICNQLISARNFHRVNFIFRTRRWGMFIASVNTFSLRLNLWPIGYTCTCNFVILDQFAWHIVIYGKLRRPFADYVNTNTFDHILYTQSSDGNFCRCKRSFTHRMLSRRRRAQVKVQKESLFADTSRVE